MTTCTGSGPAYLHGDLWVFWYNHRVKCDPEHRNLWLCEKRRDETGTGSCAEAKAIYDACDPADHEWYEYGAPEEDTRTYDYEKLYNLLYGQPWGDVNKYNRFATLKVFDGTLAVADGPKLLHQEIIAYSSTPNEPCAYMQDTSNHGDGGCMMKATSKNDRFGAFAWVAVPSGKPLTVAGLWLPMGSHYPGCDEYLAGTCLPRSSGPATGQTILPCYGYHHVTFEPGRHYLWSFSGIGKLDSCDGPPKSIVDRFSAAGVDVSKRDSCL